MQNRKLRGDHLHVSFKLPIQYRRLNSQNIIHDKAYIIQTNKTFPQKYITDNMTVKVNLSLNLIKHYTMGTYWGVQV